MTQNKSIMMWVTILGGWFGLHKFMNKEIGMGVLYLFTAGLFCIGWIVDSIKAIKEYLDTKGGSTKKSMMPKEALDMISNGSVARIEPDTDIPVMLSKGEELYYVEYGSTSKSKTRVAGYKSGGSGYSVRIAKGISLHTGGGQSKAIRETTTTIYNGVIYLTNKRIIYTSQGNPFEVSIPRVTSIRLAEGNNVVIQHGKSIHEIKIPTAKFFIEAFKLVSSAR